MKTMYACFVVLFLVAAVHAQELPQPSTDTRVDGATVADEPHAPEPAPVAPLSGANEKRLISTNSVGSDSGIWQGTHVLSPGGGQVRGNTQPVTGYLKIALPQSWTNTMIRMAIDIYEYQPSRARTVFVGGYAYLASARWYNTFATQAGSTDDQQIKVDFGHDGNVCALWLSKGSSGAATTWAYPQILVRDFYAGYLGTDPANWDDGWTVSFTTTLGTITSGASQTAYPSVAGDGTAGYIPKFITNARIASSSIYDNGNVGIGTANPQTPLHVNKAVSTWEAKFEVPSGPSVSLAHALGHGIYVDGGPTASSTTFPLRVYAGSVPYFAVRGDGMVGIGNEAPNAKLDVTGNTNVSGTTTTGLMVVGAVGGAGQKLTVNGDIYATGQIRGAQVLGAVYQDVAEWVPASADLKPGTVVIIDSTTTNRVKESTTSYDTSVAGVVSAQPGIVLGTGGADKEQIATTGRVRVHVDASVAPIRIGDLLVTSDKPGVAMRSTPIEVNGRSFHQPGTIIGKALEPLESGEGEILVLLSLQ